MAGQSLARCCAYSTPLGSLDRVAANTRYEIDVTPLSTGDGLYSLLVTLLSADEAVYSSKEDTDALVKRTRQKIDASSCAGYTDFGKALLIRQTPIDRTQNGCTLISARTLHRSLLCLFDRVPTDCFPAIRDVCCFNCDDGDSAFVRLSRRNGATQ